MKTKTSSIFVRLSLAKNLAAFVYDDHDLEELEEWVQTQIESTQFYDILFNIVGAANLISAQVYSPVGVAFNERNRAELVYDVDTDRVTIYHYRDLSMIEIHQCLNDRFLSRSTSVVCALSEEFQNDEEDSLFQLKTVSVCELPDLVGSLKKIKESVNA